MTTACTKSDLRAVPVPDIDADDLREMMGAVNQAAQRLQQTHDVLHRQVARLESELAEANAQLRRTRDLAALGEMAAGIAHEVRNPLGSIQLYVQMLGEDLADRPPQRELCDKVRRAVTGLDAVVADILHFARDVRLRLEPTDTRTLFDRALESSHALIHDGGVEVIREPGPGCDLSADPALLGTALANVIRNAVEAMSEIRETDRRRRLTLGADTRLVRCPAGDRSCRVILSVADTGPGVPETALRRMFNPFFTTRPTGTGLGLAIVHRLVDAHGGHIVVTNPAGGGARFDLCLPPVSVTPSGSVGVAPDQEGDP